jgi:RimJ/RimL family protein N-acetyltransferase
VPGPFLIGKRVQLRPLTDEDAPNLADWINDPEIRRLVLSRFAKSIKDEKEWLASMSSTGTPQNIALGVEVKRGKRLIGTVGLHTIDWVQRRAMTGILIHPLAFRGKGYGTEAKNLMLDYAFGELGMLSLWALALEGNAASIRALLKQGYKRSGVHRKSTLVQGVWVDSIYFDILREEWEELRGGARRRRTGR